MKKGIITTLVVTICMMLTATYAFAASSKTEKKEVKKEVTTTEKQKETTTAEKPKTETKESEEPNMIQIFKQVMQSSRSVKSVIYVKVLKFPKKNLKKPRKKTKSLMQMKIVNMRIVKIQR